jgi:hypothetical protein
MKRRRRSNSLPVLANDDESQTRICSRRSGASTGTTSARTSGSVSSENFDPSLVGTVVPPHTRRAGRYLLGNKLGVSPVKSIVQCLARLERTDHYFQVKLLTLFSGTTGRHAREESQDEKQGKVCKQD